MVTTEGDVRDFQRCWPLRSVHFRFLCEANREDKTTGTAQHLLSVKVLLGNVKPELYLPHECPGQYL